MNMYKRITSIFVEIVSTALILLVADIVGIMLYELCLRSFSNKSSRASTEACGLLFMWMAFLDIIVLYDKDCLITLDMLYVRAPRSVQNIFWFINKIFGLGPGLVMIVAYAGMYRINSTSHFSTMQFLSKAWCFLLMAIAGGFITVKTIYQLLERIMVKTPEDNSKGGMVK